MARSFLTLTLALTLAAACTGAMNAPGHGRPDAGGSTDSLGGGASSGAGGSASGGASGTTGGSGAAGGTQPTDASPSRDATPTPDPGPTTRSRGATVPWVEHEAEAAATNGVILVPGRTFGTIAAESSGRSSVRLDNVGQYVEFTATRAANAIVVRYVIPDAPAGGGINATLNLYVNGVLRRPLALTSKYAWSYGGEAATSNDPSARGEHHFFDEARALIGDVPAGAKVKLQKDAANSAAYYVIDLIDLEQVAPPSAMPDNTFFSVTTDCGAIPDDGRDDARAIQNCVHKARAQDKNVWIPAGTFDITTRLESDLGIMTANTTIRGAGMWHTTLRGPWARFHCTGSNCRFFDFAILGDSVARDDASPENGFNGGAGTNSRLDNIWVEHTKAGFWVGAGMLNVTNGLVIANSRFRNLFADGVNFCNGTSNSEVVNSHFRNTGDDALASWAPSFEGGVNTNNVFHFNTVQLPWRANCFAIYGGRDNRIEDNVCADVVTYPGILIAQQFNAHPFSGTTVVKNNTLIRAGGPMWNQQHGALKVHTFEGAISGLTVRDITIIAPTFAGLDIQGPQPLQSATFQNVTITDAGTYGIVVRANSRGQATFTNVIVDKAASAGMSFEPPPSSFTAKKEAGNAGW